MWACGGSPFTSDADVGNGGSDEPGAGVGNGASSSGGSVGTAGRGGKPGAGGSSPIAGSASTGGALNAGGLGMAGDFVVAGSTAVAGQPGTGGSSPDPIDQVCPKVQPGDGAGCADGLTCSYGKDLRPSCRVRAQCDGGTWALDDPGCEPLPECQDIEPGSSCDDSVAPPCAIDGYVFCACTGCSGSGPCTSETVWRCAEVSGSNNCPHIMPNEGQACFDETECSYGSCATDSHMDVSCDGSTWIWTSAQCPQ